MGKCSFMTDFVLNIGYVVSKNGLSMDELKVATIRKWSTPATLHKVQSFHGLVSFYRRSINNFSSILAPIMDHMKAGKFSWNERDSCRI
jgi:hypothetical protein